MIEETKEYFKLFYLLIAGITMLVISYPILYVEDFIYRKVLNK